MQIVYIPAKRNNKTFIYDKKLIAKIATGISICLISINTYAKDLDTTKLKTKINITGNKLIDVVQFLIYWMTLLCALIDIAKSVKKQDLAGVGAIVVKYGAMMGSGYAMPWIWDMIKDLFS